MRYLIHTDLHLGHEKVFEFEPDRTSFKDIINNVKHITHSKDIIINLGDIGFKDSDYWMKEYRNACNGKIILTRGNHDKNKSYTYFYRHGIDFVCEELKLYIYGRPLIFSHMPIPVIGRQLNIHGHLHRKKSIDIIKNEYPFYDEKTHICIETTNNCELIDLKKIVDNHINNML